MKILRRILEQPMLRILTSLLITGTLLMASSGAVLADSTGPSQSQLCIGVQQVSNVSCPSQKTTAKSGTESFLHNFITILSYALGAVVVIMLIVSGLMFITSGGDANRVRVAKSAVAYALIGLVVAALAQVLAHWVLSSSSNVSNGFIIFSRWF